jgi:hypothetical protein
MSMKLPTKRDVQFILSEDLRQEAPGKLSILGFMPGATIGVGGAPPKEIPGAAFVLQSLAFLFIISGGQGKFGGSLKIFAPGQKVAVFDAPIQRPIEKIKDHPAIFATGSKPFIGTAFGTYIIQLTLENSKFRFPIRIEKAIEERKASKKG